MARVVQVAVTVTLDTGDMHTIVIRDPEPSGDNPRYLARQMKDGILQAHERLDKVIDAYGSQIRVE